ncbi:MAG: acyl-CoA carboxylase subunit beta [candidate division WOR-3 bacterium]
MDKFEKLKKLREEALKGGGEEKIKKHKEKGKKTARERIELLVDEGSFQEIDMFVTHRITEFDLPKILGDGVVTGFAKIHGRDVLVFSQDFTVFGGTLSLAHADKIKKIFDIALRIGVPIIGLNDSGGARIQEGVASLAGYAEIFLRNTLLSGVVPQISAILGPCAGGAVYSPALTDFIFMVRKTSYMFITGPDVIKAVTHEDVNFEELGGADVHAEKSGVAHFVYDSEEEVMGGIRTLLTYLPQNNMEEPPFIDTGDPEDREDPELDDIIPEDPNAPYEMKEIIRRVVDNGVFFEVHEKYAPNIIVGFARIGGFSVGIVAQEPMHLAGAIDVDASIKAARFVRFCDAFNIPIITFEDVPGFLPGVYQEHRGIIKEGAKLLYAYCEATVPKITVITRKSYGGAYCVLSSKQVRGDINLAWPTAEIAVMGPEGAINIIYRKEIQEAENPEELRKELTKMYRDKFANPYYAAAYGYIDDVIEPRKTRKWIIKGLKLLRNKRQGLPPKKHGNIPL